MVHEESMVLICAIPGTMESAYSSKSPGSDSAPGTCRLSNLDVSLQTKSIQSSCTIRRSPSVTEDHLSTLLGNKVGDAIAGMKSFKNARQ